MASAAVSPRTAAAQTYAGPITVDDNYIAAHGSTISGNFQSTSTSTPVIMVRTAQPVTILNSRLQGPGDLIYCPNTSSHSITVRNTSGTGLNPNVAGVQKGVFLHVDYAVNVVVENCDIQGTSYGVFVNGYSGNNTTGNSITIRYNRIHNIDGRTSNGQGGYAARGKWLVHAIQILHVNHVPGMEIAWNEIINDPRNSMVDDNINISNTSGTSSSHLLVHDNFIQGAYTADPTYDIADGCTSGGIITDGSGGDTLDNAVAFVEMYNNQVVSTGDYGLAIEAGNNNSIHDNRVISSGYLADGTFFPETYSQGLVNWNGPNQSSQVFFNNSVYNNGPIGLVRSDGNFTSSKPNGGPTRADWWLPGQNNDARGNYVWQPSDSLSPNRGDEYNEFLAWQSKIHNNNILVGAPVFDGFYRFTPAVNGNAALDVNGASTANGTKIQEWTWNGSNAQRWHVQYLNNGYYRLTPGVNAGSALDVQGASTADGTPTLEWGWSANNNQQWKIEMLSGGRYRVTPRINNNSCLDVSGASTTDGTVVQEWTWNGNNAQVWNITAS